MSVYRPSETLRCHRQCLDDEIRTERYRRAIAQTVLPGDVVLDVGTGTGILAFFACQAGASRVYAVDPSDIIDHAEQLSIANGFQDRIVFLKHVSSEAQLPERADVFIAGHIHNFALETGLLSSLLDARKRLLKERARFVPQEVELSIVPVECPDVYREVDVWSRYYYGFDFSSVRTFAANNFYKATIEPGAFLSDPQPLFRIDPATVRSTSLSGDVSCIAGRDGTFHGIAGWFRARLSPGVELANEPGNKSADWAQILFPLKAPVPVSRGEPINMKLTTIDGTLWRWRVQAGDVQYDQSTFLGTPFSKDVVARHAPDFKPRLSRTGEAELFLLRAFMGEKTTAAIQQDFLRAYSGHFESATAALAFFRKALRSTE